MKIMKLDILLVFLLLGWIDIAISRSAVKVSVKSSNQSQTKTKNLSLDLSSDGPNPSGLISQIFTSTVEELLPQIQHGRTVSIVLDITAPPGSHEQYLSNIEATLSSILQRFLLFPRQGFIRTRIQENDDGTVASITVTVSILPSNNVSQDLGPIDVDLSKPGSDMKQILKRTLSRAVQHTSIHGNTEKSNNITLQIIPPQRLTKEIVHKMIGTIESILITLLPNTEFSIKPSISRDSDGIVSHITCVIKIDEMASQNQNLFSYNIDMAKIADGLDRRIINILRNIQSKVEAIFNDGKPVFMNLKIKPSPRSYKQSIVNIIDTVMSTLKNIFSNRLELTVDIYENYQREIYFLTLDIIIQPINAIELDLTVLDRNSIQRITYELSKLKSTLVDKEDIDKCTSFTLILEPPPNADRTMIGKITDVVTSIISRTFPDNEIKIQAKNTKNNEGSVSKITLVITIEPNLYINDRQDKGIVYIDLSKPATDLIQKLKQSLPRLKNKLNKKFPVPVNLTLNIQPPDKSTEIFIRKTLTRILVYLSENFPHDKIKSEATAEENPQGYVKNMAFVFTIIPSSLLRTPINSKTLNINLMHSESELVPELIKILPKVNRLIETDQTANLSLNIRPPPGSNDEVIKNMVKSVITIVSEMYPTNKLEFQMHTLKNPQGITEKIIIFITIAPAPPITKNRTKKIPEAFNFNITIPGKNLLTETVNILPILKTKITEQHQKGLPIRIHLNIGQPKGLTTDYVKEAGNRILTIISKLCPRDQVSVKVKIKKNHHGKISKIVFIITVVPNPDEPNTTLWDGLRPSTTQTPSQTPNPSSGINLDLSKPGTNITVEILTTLTKIKKQLLLKRKVGKPVTLLLNIEPPTGSNQQFVDNTVNTVVTSLTTLFPNDRIEVNLKIFRNRDKIITNISLFLVISPKIVNTEAETTTENLFFTTSTSDDLHEVKLDLSNPETNIAEELKVHILKIKYDIIKNNLNDQPVTFKLNIQPPKDSTEEYEKNTVNVIITTLSDLFPDKRIKVKLRITKNPNGSLATITMIVKIEPSTNTKSPTITATMTDKNIQETTTTMSHEKSPSTSNEVKAIKIHIDLSNPKTTIDNEIIKILPDINDEVIQEHPKGRPVEIKLNIKPPNDSSEQSVRTTVKTILQILKTVYPDNNIGVKVKVVKDENSKITNITVVLSIEPSTKQKFPLMINLFTADQGVGNTETTTPLNPSTPSRETIYNVISPKSNSESQENISSTSKQTTTPDEEITKSDTATSHELEVTTTSPPTSIKIKMTPKESSITTQATSVNTSEKSSGTEGLYANTITPSSTKKVFEEPTTSSTANYISERSTITNEGFKKSDTLETKAQKVSSTTSPSIQETNTPSADISESDIYQTVSEEESSRSTSSIGVETSKQTTKSEEEISKSVTDGRTLEMEVSTTTLTTGDNTSMKITITPTYSSINEHTSEKSKEFGKSDTVSTTSIRSIPEGSTSSEGITKSDIGETRTEVESSGTTPSISVNTSKQTTHSIFTSSTGEEQTTPSIEELSKVATGQTGTKIEYATTTISTGENTSKQTTKSNEEISKLVTPKESNTHNEETTDSMATETTLHITKYNSGITSTEKTSFAASTEEKTSEEASTSSEDITQSVISETNGESASSIPTLSTGEARTPSATISSGVNKFKQTSKPNEDISKMVTAKTTPEMKVSTTIPSRGDNVSIKIKMTPKKSYIATQSINENTSEKSWETEGRSTNSITPSTIKNNFEKTTTSSVDKYISEQSTITNEEFTKYGTLEPNAQKVSSASIPSIPEASTSSEYKTDTFIGEKITEEELSSTTYSISVKTSTQTTKSNEKISKTITAGTTPKMAPTGNTPSTVENTPKESNTHNGEITDSVITETTLQVESSQKTSSKDNNVFEVSTTPNNEMTKPVSGLTRAEKTSSTVSTEGNASEETSTSIEDINQSDSSETRTEAQSPSTTPSISVKTSEQTTHYILTPSTGEEQTTPSNEELSKVATGQTETEIESATTDISTGENTSKQITKSNEEISNTTPPVIPEASTSSEDITEEKLSSPTVESSTISSEEITVSIAGKTKPLNESSTTTPSASENTSKSEEEIIVETKRPEISSSVTPITSEDESRKVTSSNKEITESFSAEIRPQTVSPKVSTKTTYAESTTYTEYTAANENISNQIIVGTLPGKINRTTTPSTDENSSEENTATSHEEITEPTNVEIRPQTESSRATASTGDNTSEKLIWPDGRSTQSSSSTTQKIFQDEELTTHNIISGEVTELPNNEFKPEERPVHILTSSSRSTELGESTTSSGDIQEFVQTTSSPTYMIPKTKPIKEKVYIDLSKPDSTLSEEVTRILPTMMPNITSHLAKKTSVTIHFVIKPPNRSTQDHLETTIQSLSQILTNYFPENKIKVRVKAQKNPQGYITEITMKITLQPTILQNPKSDNIDIDLSEPGVTLAMQINRILADILPNITKSLKDKHPVTLPFRIKPGIGTTQSYIPVATKSLESVLTQYFPKNKIAINVKAEKDSKGYLTEIIIVITIEPPQTQNPVDNISIDLTSPRSTIVQGVQPTTLQTPRSEDIDIDLSQPGVTLAMEINKILADILPNITKSLKDKRPVTLPFRIKPGIGTTQSYIPVAIKSLESVLTQYFPKNKIAINVKAEKDSQGYLTEIIIVITIEPPQTQIPVDNISIDLTSPRSTTVHGVQPTTLQTPRSEDIDIDLSQPGVTLAMEINKILADILPDITKSLNDKHPVSLSFRIKPHKGMTQSYIPEATRSLENVLTQYFPKNKIAINVKAEKDSQGYLTEIIIVITIEPPQTQNPVDNISIDLTSPRSTTVHGVQPTTLQTPRSEDIDIDLSEPGVTLAMEINRILADILPNITKSLKDKRPVTLPFRIKPGIGTTQSYIPVAIKSLESVLTQYFPKNKIAINVKAEKDSQGYLTEIIIVITIEPPQTQNPVDNISIDLTSPRSTTVHGVQPTTFQTPRSEDIDIDLSQPGVTLAMEINKILADILPDITKSLNDKHPVSLSFRMKPHNGMTQSYIPEATRSLENVLTQYFPKNKIAIKVKAEKDSQGYLTEIIIVITIEPPQTQNPVDNISIDLTSPRSTSVHGVQPTTLQTPRSEDIDIDLSQPGVTLAMEINKILADILPDITKSLNDKHPVSLSFRIKPHNGMTQSYIPEATRSLENVLTQYFPKNKIAINVKAEKDSQGYLTEIIIVISIEPPPTQNPEDNITIDLTSPGSTIVHEVQEIIPSILYNITERLSKELPYTLNFKVKPPTGSTESYLQEIIGPLQQILSTYLPYNEVNIHISAQKNSRGYLTEVTIEIIIEPSLIKTPNEEKVDIDLSKPGTVLSDQVKIIMTSILPSINEDLSNQHSVTLNFTIKPPTGSTENYLQVLTESLQSILGNYFPNNKIDVRIRASKNPQGYITIVMMEITLMPPENPTNAVEKVDIDLTKPRENLINQVTEKLPYIMNNIKEKLSKKQNSTINFNIKPPSGSTESYLKVLADSLETILTTYFPNNKIDVQINAQKNSHGYISDVIIGITIQPTLNTVSEDDVDIDLTKPGVTLPNQLKIILPNVKQNIAEQLANNQTVSLSFKIKPPKGSTQDYLQILSKSLQIILMEYFPTNKISIEISAQKDSQDYITEVTIEISIRPSITQPPNDEDVDIDLSKPGVTLNNQMPKILPHILPNVAKNLSLGQPVTLSFKIRPPLTATESYLQVTAETMEAILSKYFPTNHINVDISARKNSYNQLTLITIEMTIQPSSTKISKQKQNVLIDLTKPGVKLIDEVSEYLASLTSNVTANMANGQSVNITLDIKPPVGSMESYIQGIVEAVIPVLKKYYPNYKVNLETSAEKDSQGYVTAISLMITIEPPAKPQDNNFNIDIDLVKSKLTLIEQVNNIIPNILQRIHNYLNAGESVTLKFNVLPPSGSKKDYLKKLTRQLVPVLSKFFPGDEMSIKSNAQKNSRGFIISITIEMTIQASIQPKKIDIDLSRPRSTLQVEISNILPKILPGLKIDLGHGKPITLRLNIRPPAYSNRSFLNEISNQIVVLLPKYLPTNRMSIKTSSTEDDYGFLSDIILMISIQP